MGGEKSCSSEQPKPSSSSWAAPPLYSSAESCAEVSQQAVAGIAQDLPVLMYGSGDSSPGSVDQESVQVLAELTANYVANLVAAAVDAHEVYTDGQGYIAPTTLYTCESNQRQSLGGVGRRFEDAPALCAGLDFGTCTSKYQSKKPKTSTAISARSFIFPICHNATLYGKVLDIQSARRDIGPELTDKVMMDTIRDECGEDATFPSSEGDVLPSYRLDDI
jgi:hypothetical protein